MKNSVRKGLAGLAIAASLALSVTTPLFAQLSARVNFAPGNDNAALNGTITGREYRDYVLNARAGQTMSVALITDDGTTQGKAFFNILPPGSNDVAIYNGSTDSDGYTSLVLPQDGDYTIRVYLMGEAYDSNYTVPFMVSVTIM